MKIKPLNAIEKSIEDYVVNVCGLTYSVHYTGTHNHDNWGVMVGGFSLGVKPSIISLA